MKNFETIEDVKKEMDKRFEKHIKKEIQIVLKTFEAIIQNCSVYKKTHDLAYDLNDEYKLLWDNLSEKQRNNIIKARIILSIKPTCYKWLFRIGTLGVSYLIEMLFGHIKNKKDIEYVTSESFTDACILANHGLNYIEQEYICNSLMNLDTLDEKP